MATNLRPQFKASSKLLNFLPKSRPGTLATRLRIKRDCKKHGTYELLNDIRHRILRN